MLVETNYSFSEYVLRSADYLNCPKFILNGFLDCIYRQFYDDTNKAEKSITELLRKYNFSEPHKKAAQFVNWRKSIKMEQFNKLNVNSFIDNVPLYVLRKHDSVNEWFKNHTKNVYSFGQIVYRSVQSYPFSKL